jgi:hypothetical protein
LEHALAELVTENAVLKEKNDKLTWDVELLRGTIQLDLRQIFFESRRRNSSGPESP